MLNLRASSGTSIESPPALTNPVATHPEDLLPPQPVGALHGDAAVEAAGAQQGGVEDVGPFGVFQCVCGGGLSL